MRQLIEKLLLDRKISKMDFYAQIGMSSTGFNQSLENNSMKVSTLQKIAEVLGIPISYFFPENEKQENAEILELLRENRELRKEIDRLKENANAPVGHGIPKLMKQKK